MGKCISINNYRYGGITKTLEKAALWLNANRGNLKRKFTEFDYPEYCGMPKNISHRLSTDEVDFLQSETCNWWRGNG
jgi:hypothetical protein